MAEAKPSQRRWWLLGCGAAAIPILFIVFAVVVFHYLSSFHSIDKKEAADVVMRALQQRDYGRVYTAFEPGGSLAREFGSAKAIQNWIESRHLELQTWKWTGEGYLKGASRGIGRSSGSGTAILYGAVTFTDGATGTVEIHMEALGLQRDPWRFSSFDLKRQDSAKREPSATPRGP
jgi:hypothetical protein